MTKAAYPHDDTFHLELAALAAIPFGAYALIVYPLEVLAFAIGYATPGTIRWARHWWAL